jgi:hypothetical protein
MRIFGGVWVDGKWTRGIWGSGSGRGMSRSHRANGEVFYYGAMQRVMFKGNLRRLALLMLVTWFPYPVWPTMPTPRYAQVTVYVHRYEGGAFVIEQLECKEVEDFDRGTVIKKDPGLNVYCGYGLETSRLPSKNIIHISSIADTNESRAAEDKIFGEFIAAIKCNPEVDGIDCFVGQRVEC